LSHPETALHAVAACILIWFFRGRSLRGARDAALVAIGTVLVTSPWWGSVLAQHGLGVFASALQTGAHSNLSLIPWLRFDFSQEPFVALLTVIGMLGLVVQVTRREWFLPVWTLLPFIVEPRSGPAVAILPLAMLTAVGLMDFVLPKIASMSDDAGAVVRGWVDALACSRAARLVAAGVLLYGLFGAFAYDLSLAQVVVPASARDAMAWVRENTPPDARLLLITGVGDPFEDATAEWFPALTGRTSVDTIQGREWQLGSQFMPFLQQVSDLQACINEGPDCLQASTNGAVQLSYDYVVVPVKTPLMNRLSSDSDFRLVFRDTGVAIFEKK
jgi:hypothetical protein